MIAGKYLPRSPRARSPGRYHKSAHLSPAPIGSQPIPQEDHPDDSPLPNPIRDIAITERGAQLLINFRSASAMAVPRSIVSRCATAWAEILERALWAIRCRFRCRLLLAEVPDGSHRTQCSNNDCSCGRREKQLESKMTNQIVLE